MNTIYKENQDFLYGNHPNLYNKSDIYQKIRNKLKAERSGGLLPSLSSILLAITIIMIGIGGIGGILISIRVLLALEGWFWLRILKYVLLMVFSSFIVLVAVFFSSVLADMFTYPNHDDIEPLYQKFLKNYSLAEGQIMSIENRQNYIVHYEYKNNYEVLVRDNFEISHLNLDLEIGANVTVAYDSKFSVLL